MSRRVQTVSGVSSVQGELMVFLVTSKRAGRPPYRVDLACYGGNGVCDCIWFRTKFEPIVSRGNNCGVPLRCEHLRRARAFFVDELIAKMLKEGKVHDDSKQQH